MGYALQSSDQVRPGILSSDAVERATTYERLPVLWLGDTFQGLNLVEALEVTYPIARSPDLDESIRGEVEGSSFYLIYGDCLTADGTRCIAPLQIIIKGPGTVPPPAQIDRVISPIALVRGSTVVDVGHASLIWFDNGVVLNITAAPEIRAAVIASLRSANHEVMEYSPFASGKNFDGASRVALSLPNLPFEFGRDQLPGWTGTDEFGYGRAGLPESAATTRGR